MNVYSLNEDDVYVTMVPHNAGPPVPVPVLPHVEGCVLSYGEMFAKRSANVLTDGARAIQLGHDVGALIPHCPVPPVPPNPLLTAHMAFSSCKVMFGKSRVLLNGVPAGWYLHLAAMLHVCADPTPVPAGAVVSASWTTVKYGFSWTDLLLGYADIDLDISFSCLLREGRKVGGGWDDKVVRPDTKGYQGFVDRIADRLSQTGNRVAEKTQRPLPSFSTIRHFLDKGGRAWLKKGISKKVPTKTRDLAEFGRDVIDALGSDAPEPDPPPTELHDPDGVFEEGMVDEVPLLHGAP